MGNSSVIPWRIPMTIAWRYERGSAAKVAIAGGTLPRVG